MGKTWLITMMVLMFSAVCNITNGQATASATATAVILPYAGTERLNDLSFGSFTNNSRGSITLGAAGVTKTTGSIRAFDKGTGQLASFSIMGAEYAYDIMLPSKPVTISSNTKEGVMEVSNFTITPSAKNYEQGTNQTFSIGATLTVQPGTSAGSYLNSTPITVIVNFN